MQVNNQDAIIRQFTQPVSANSINAVKPQSATDAKTAEAAAEGEKKPDVDRLELSEDAKAATTKLTDDERASLVKSLKDDLDNQMNRFTNMMLQNFQKQGITASMAQGDDFWKMMASGNFTVDAKTKAEAQEAISENGYWGVSQTSQRIFDFAKAVAGDDPDQMKKMQAAVEKGFKQAEDAWGGPMPSITGETHDAVNKLFDDYYTKNGVVA